MLPRRPPFRGTGAPAGRAACPLPAPHSGVQATCRDWRPCHHPAHGPQRSGQRNRALPPLACLPQASSRSPVPVSGSSWGDRGGGPSWLVMRQIQQTAAADGELQTLDPPLITCQPARPSATPKSRNKRPFLIIFNKELFITSFVGAINMPGV